MNGGMTDTAGRHRKLVLAIVFALLGAPPLLVTIGATRYHVHNRSNGLIVSSGEEREYLLHVPKVYDSKTPAPLVISLHGGATWPGLQRNLSGWDQLADEHGFLVVYPAGTGMPRRWNTFATGEGLDQDVRFIADLIDTLKARYRIDSTRIYADGLSNGGGMAFVLSCTLADRIAAVGMVAPAQTLPPDWCPDPRPMPMMVFHGDAVPILPYQGGPMGGLTPVRPFFRPARDLVGWWAARNQCAMPPVETTIALDVVRTEYQGCAVGAPVVFHTLIGGGHTWPGGEKLPEWLAGPTNQNIDATTEMWAFFRRHVRR